MTQTYARLARQIAALQASAQKQLAIEAKGAIAKINDMISTYGLTAGDLKFTSTAASAVRP
jgi:DNA-binding protein H-NS